MMQKLLIWLELPFFALKLAFSVFPSLIRASAPDNIRLTPLLPALIFLVVILSQHYTHNTQQLSANSGQQTSGDSGLVTQVSTVLEEEIQFWLNWYEIQPTHRDVLMNLHYLYDQAGDEEKALYYLKQAQKVDPNSPLVKQQ